MKSNNKYMEFLPDSRNLGGKRNIEFQQKNHLLALVNIRPTINTQKQPHKHVNSKHKSQKKNIQRFDEFKEVDEAFRRVNQLKKGGIDNTAPLTMQRTAYMNNRIPKGKNIVMQDHSRNIKALLSRLDDVEKSHQKKVQNIKKLNYGNLNTSKFQNSQYTSGNSMLRRESSNSILSKQNNLQPRKFNNFLQEDMNDDQNQKFLKQHGLYEEQNDEVDDKIEQGIQNQEIYKDMYDQYDSDLSGEYSENEEQQEQYMGEDDQIQNSRHKQKPSNAMDMSEGYKFLEMNKNRQQNEENQENNFSIHSHSVRDYSQFTELGDRDNQQNFKQQNQVQSHNYKQDNSLKLNSRPIQKFNIRPQSAKTNLNNKTSKFGFSNINNNSNNNKTHAYIYQPDKQRQQQQQQQLSFLSNNKYNIPFIPKRQIGDPYRELRRAILNIVMEQNLFEKNVIKKELAQQAKKANPHLQKQMIQDICNQICFNLFGSL